MTVPKLVRDRIPEIIRATGAVPDVRTASLEEYRDLLMAKLHEEVDEFCSDESVEELADVLEVVWALADVLGYDRDHLEKVRADKATERGGFDGRVVWSGNDVIEREEGPK